jgi:hypothetical protein
MFYFAVDFMILGSLVFAVQRILQENKNLRGRLRALESRPKCRDPERRTITGVITLFKGGRRKSARACFELDRR